ncbi:RNA chaperone Hfq [Rossellomorea sp. NPDC071047]|uniref:RNA chaperone Hfq n=1 Tax=Rossellomorea sp. NPDC071047 TaxID=3390675 RepID=UPI003CFC65B8
MAKSTINIQDNLLNQVRAKKIPVTIFLTSGFQMNGNVEFFDGFTILLNVNGRQQLVYKHAISTIIPRNKFQVNL